MIRTMAPEDFTRILEIYKMGLDSRNATFETDVPSIEDWDNKHLRHSRLVYVENKEVIGWIALSPVSSRKAYEGVAEISVYVDNKAKGKGIGSQLMYALINSSEEHGIWTLFSSVFSENIATLKLHEKFGFRIIGYREKISCLDGIWRNTVLLERRSKII